ncbi:MAG TPA: serine/threonine protein kinase [Candidatus Stackebrandtia excrementipullorum]|nr:serine/threonine protein kinase [Candidatus Stackebrandtia excrementipullorum]
MRGGEVLKNRYRLDQCIGTGGMSEVWRAHDLMLERAVAIKILHPALAADPTFRQRFLGEARTLASLNAPGLINLYDAHEEQVDDGPPLSYLVMELVQATPLSQILRERGRLDPVQVASIVAQCATALDAAHGAGIVHRDVKPANILVSETGDVTLIDFGIARTRGHSALTSAGSIVGTIEYASPEQLRSDQLGPASDVYSLGVVAYECLAGRLPFEADSTPALITAHLNDQPPPLPDDVPAEQADAVMTALAKDPHARFVSAADMAKAVSSETPPRATRTMGMATIPPAPTVHIEMDEEPEKPPVSFEQRLRRRTFTAVAATLGVVVLIVAAAVLIWTGGDDAKEPAAQETSTTPSKTPSPSPTGPDAPATSTLANAHSGQCINVHRGFLFTYAEFVGCTDGAPQFEFVPGPSSDDVFKIALSAQPDICLNWTYGRNDVEPGDCDFNTAWKLNWIESTEGVDVWQIQSVSNGNYCLAAGTERPQGQDCTEDANQRWHTQAEARLSD